MSTIGDIWYSKQIDFSPAKDGIEMTKQFIEHLETLKEQL